MENMLVTCDVSHLEMSWLNLNALENMPEKSTTDFVSHLLKSPLKDVLYLNASVMSVTHEISHSGMTPNMESFPNRSHKPCTGSSSRHFSMANSKVSSWRRFLSSVRLAHCTDGGRGGTAPPLTWTEFLSGGGKGGFSEMVVPEDDVEAS